MAADADANRLQKLQEMLKKEPDDPFLLYGIAMEYRKLSNAGEALEYLARVLQKDPNYCVAYHQAALIHENSGDVAAAKDAYRQGIAAAARKGDLHAKGEMEAALSMIVDD